MKHILIFFLLYAALISCSRKINTIEIDGIEVRPEVPPACVKIRDNFYADQTEVANVHYREYAYWIKGVYGDSSSTYRKTIVRNVQWVDVDSVTLQDMGYYFVHPMFNFYPILGISHDQAINYCKWRSDRVYEGILIREKIIRKEFPRDSSSCFTIERYQAGKFLHYKPDKKILTPRFRLPTENEWQLIVFGGLNEDLFPFGIDSNDKRVIRVLKKNLLLYNTVEWQEDNKDSTIKDLPSPVFSGVANKYGIYNTIGNVAEMVSERRIAKGGSWHDPLEKCEIRKRIYYSEPTSWLGFRCVCTWEIPK